ncbi:hypothetical protein V8D89_016077 [Ganoderma adspersum]
MSQPPLPSNPRNQPSNVPNGTNATGGVTGTAPTVPNTTIGAAITSVQTPSRNIPLASDFGLWGPVVIETANQAQNVWHAALVEGNVYAIRFLRDFNRTHQDRTIRRMEGRRILMRSFPSNSQYLWHEHSDTMWSRRNARSRT